ncbi:inositol 1,4,5-triphosphate receptor associated 1-like isoform X2 [Polyodon spathula]|uniref:inositol 1,4,5-triphosphate receptor associated 1-like isoform X2 n=1 Tax=Polyodon spathula TaxID=7913 RepID=UPI001B7E55EF|nr:inositol 1,4,5-triphosphate receptor associated 1-like isoform X2 [Polyodon spathula]
MPILPEEEEEEEAAKEQDRPPPSPVVAVEARMVSTPSIVLPKEAVTADQETNALSQSRPHSPRHRHRSSFSSVSSITTVDSTGHVIDLVKDQLPDVKLSDKDTKKNLELLEEAKKVSERFFMRRGRRSTCSLSDSPTGVSPTLTPRSSPVPSRSSSLTQPPQIASDGTAVNSAGSSPTPQHLDVPSARGQTDSIGLDTESSGKGLLDRQVNEQWKISQGLLSPRPGSHGNSKEVLSEQKENCDSQLIPPNTESRKLCESPARVQRSVEYNDCPLENTQPQKSAAGALNPGLKAPTKAHKNPTGACTAELKSFGSGPALMRAVSWDGMEQASLRNGAQDLSTMTDKSFTLYDKSGSQLLKSTGYKDFPVQPVKTQKLVKLREENMLLRNQTMAGLKLPDLSETAEQERGPSSLPSLPPPIEEELKEKPDVMPNISDVMLRKLKVLRSLPGREVLWFVEKLRKELVSSGLLIAPPLTEKEIENAFVQLSLAFRNDSYTLETRLRQAERERAQTEDNTDKELEDFKRVIKGSILQWQNCEQRESYQRLLETIAVFHRLASRLSSRAEMVGAVRQEKRMSKATEVMMQYVENLKRTYEKDHAELIEYKKLANQNSSRYGAIDSGEDGVPRASRSMSLTPGKALPRRRVSVAVVPKFNLLNIPNQSPGAMTNTSLPSLCEVNSGRNRAPTSPVQPPTAENGKASQDQENATPVLASPPSSRDEIRSEIKVKSEEDAYNKGYQEGLKRSKELQEVKEEEEKLDESKKEAEEKEKELEMEKEIENKKSSKFKEALDYIDRLCPKVYRQHRLVWIIAAVVLILAFVVSIFTSYNNSSTEVADTSPGKSACSGKKQYFGWNVGLQQRNPTQE